MQAKNPHFNDTTVGKRIRYGRKMMKISQEELGRHLEISFQQIQKYEKRINCVSAGRLQEISNILHVPICFFYTDISTKENVTHYHNGEILSKTEYLLLKNFRELEPKNKKQFCG